MTNFIKKLIAATTLLGLVTVTPAFAECQSGMSLERLQTDAKAQEENGLKLVAIPDTALKTFVEKAGDPPNTDTSKPYSGYLLQSSELGMLFIVQDGCVTTNAGPSPLQGFLNALGLAGA